MDRYTIPINTMTGGGNTVSLISTMTNLGTQGVSGILCPMFIVISLLI